MEGQEGPRPEEKTERNSYLSDFEINEIAPRNTSRIDSPLLDQEIKREPWDEVTNIIQNYVYLDGPSFTPEKFEDAKRQLDEKRSIISEALSQHRGYIDTLIAIGKLTFMSDEPFRGKQLALELVKENVPLLENSIKQGATPKDKSQKAEFNCADARATMVLVKNVLKADPDEMHKFIERTVPFIIVDPQKPGESFEILGIALNAVVDDEQKVALEGDIRQKLEEIEIQDRDKAFSCLSRLKADGDQSKEIVEKIVEEKLQSYGIDIKDMDKALGYSGRDIDILSEKIKNLSNIAFLEEKIPGGARILQKEFGINYYYRYPEQMLLQQVQDKDNNDLPFGIGIGTYADHNGVLNSPHLWQNINGQLQGKYYLRLFEAAGKIDIGRALITCKRNYGPQPEDQGHKISFAFIAGHGTPEGIKFGREELTIGDLIGSTPRKVSEIFENNPTIVLLSCSTGAKDGFAKRLQESIGGKVIGPDKPTTSYIEIQATFPDGTIDFDVTYDGGSEYNTQTKTYGSK